MHDDALMGVGEGVTITVRYAIAILLAGLVAGGVVYYFMRPKDATPESEAGASTKTPVTRAAGQPAPGAKIEEAGAKAEDSDKTGFTIGAELKPGQDQPDITVRSDDVAGASVEANVTKGSVKVQTEDDHIKGLRGMVEVDKKGDVSGKVEYKVEF